MIIHAPYVIIMLYGKGLCIYFTSPSLIFCMDKSNYRSYIIYSGENVYVFIVIIKNTGPGDDCEEMGDRNMLKSKGYLIRNNN